MKRTLDKFHLGDIEAQDELERQEKLILVAEYTEHLKTLLGLFISTYDEPVGDAGEGVDEAVEEELVPDTLEEAAAPDAEDTESVSPACSRDEL